MTGPRFSPINRRAVAARLPSSSSRHTDDHTRVWQATRWHSSAVHQFRGSSSSASSFSARSRWSPASLSPSLSPPLPPPLSSVPSLCFHHHANNDVILFSVRRNNASSPPAPRSVGIRWNTTDNGTTTAAVAADDGPTTASASIHAPFESHRSSATVRHQQRVTAASTTPSSPLPGRLIRKPRARSRGRHQQGNVDGSPRSSFTGDAKDFGDGVYPPGHPPRQPSSEPPPQSRQAQRKAAIERRRVFLENGGAAAVVTAATPSTLPDVPIAKDDEVPNNHVADDKGMGEGKNHDDDGDIGTDGTQQSIPPHHEQQQQQQRRRKIPLHSIRSSGNSSAADLHRLQLQRQRDHQKREQQQLRQHQQQEQGLADHTTRLRHDIKIDTAAAATTTMTPPKEATARTVVGGSIVASQSATAKFRLRRRGRRNPEAKSDATAETSENEGSNSKTNPSVVTIPLVATDREFSEDEYDRVAGGGGGPSRRYDGRPSPRSDENFEERYQRWRGRQRQGETAGGATGDEGGGSYSSASDAAADGDDGTKGDGSWSPFGWLFWGRKK